MEKVLFARLPWIFSRVQVMGNQRQGVVFRFYSDKIKSSRSTQV